MASSSFDPCRVIAVVGPTGSGKSSLARQVARDFDGEIVCMDSMQLYREVTIGTARPDAEDEATVPHHLFGCISVNETFNSARYCEMASAVISDIQRRAKVPILVGGTGLYMRALFEGMADLPETPPSLRQRLQERINRKGLPSLFKLLQRLDPHGAAQLHANDAQRIQRFLEVRILSGASILNLWEQQQSNQAPKPITVGLQVERAHLWERLQARARSWLNGGWIEETQSLIKAGLLERVLEVGPLGYREISQYLCGTLTFEQMEERIFIATRQYAKRQMTWFRKASYIQWFPFDRFSGYNMKSVTDFIKMKWGNRPILSID